MTEDKQTFTTSADFAHIGISPKNKKFEINKTVGSFLAFLKSIASGAAISFNNLINKTKTSNINHSYRNLKNKNLLQALIIGVVAVSFLGLVFYFGRSRVASTANVLSGRPVAPKAIDKTNLNRVYEFPIRDNKGVEVSKIRYEITSIELYDSIIYKGQRARAVEGRAFLILNLKLLNQYTQEIAINSRDYIRLSVNKKDEKIAPDIHNDPVKVQAISTKYTRIGFPINESDKNNLNLYVGEINGEKQAIDVSL